MAHLGFIGLGVMGSRMVKRLLDAGHTVTGYNRTRSKAQWLLELGMRWGETPAAVAQADRRRPEYGGQYRGIASRNRWRGRGVGRVTPGKLSLSI